MKPYFPAYTQFASVTDSHDPYFIIDHPVKGTSVKIKLSDLTPKLIAAMLTEMGDRPNRILRTNSDGDLVLSSYPIAFGTAAGTDTYTVTLDPAIDAITTGVPFLVKFTNTNTTTSTLAVNGLAAKFLQKNVVDPLAANDIIPDKYYMLVYDGSAYQVLNMPDEAPEWTETTVTLGELAIEACGWTGGVPIELLPAPGAGNYYEWEITIKKPSASTVVAGTVDYWAIGDAGFTQYMNVEAIAFTGVDDKIILASSNSLSPTSIAGANVGYAAPINQAINFTTLNGNNPTSATGNLTAVIRYKIKSF